MKWLSDEARELLEGIPLVIGVACFDDSGAAVFRASAPPAEALDKVIEFFALHGCDPDEDGAGARSGRVEFSPED